MRVEVEGGAQVDLDQQSFVAAGGQGSVFVKGDTAFKVFADESQALPRGKIYELSSLSAPPFCKPEKPLLRGGAVVGYTSRFVRDSYVLCQLIPRAFREREGLSQQQSMQLVELMRAGFCEAHAGGILLIDPNEMNFLVSKDFSRLWFIDTDSYQTKSYPAVAIMDSVRDRKMSGPRAFSEGSDWFSFAVTSFQLLVGIHPFKGRHPTLKGFDERMSASVSVFNKDVSLPAAAYPLSTIPREWRSWYEAVFERDERSPPPGGASRVSAAAHTFSAAAVQLELLASYESILYVDSGLVYSKDSVWREKRLVCSRRAALVGESSLWLEGGYLYAEREGKTRQWIQAERLAVFEGRAYVKLDNYVYEVHEVLEQLTLASVAYVTQNSSTLFRGGVYQDALGSVVVSVFDAPGRAVQLRLRELDGKRFVAARFEQGGGGRVLVVAVFDGEYKRYCFKLREDFSYESSWELGEGINFVVLDSGVMVSLDDELKLCSSKPASSQSRTVSAAGLEGARLFKSGAQLLAAKGAELFKLSMSRA